MVLNARTTVNYIPQLLLEAKLTCNTLTGLLSCSLTESKKYVEFRIYRWITFQTSLENYFHLGLSYISRIAKAYTS